MLRKNKRREKKSATKNSTSINYGLINIERKKAISFTIMKQQKTTENKFKIYFISDIINK